MGLISSLLYRYLAFTVVCGCLAVVTLNPVRAAETANGAEPAATANRIHGKVTEVVNVPGYTYVAVASGDGVVWAAGPVTPVEVGATLAFLTDMPMENFHSKGMQRDFPLIYFVSQFLTDAAVLAGSAAQAANPHGSAAPEPDRTPVEGIVKLKDGNTIAEIYTRKSELAGQTIRVRGKVSKFNAQVMGRNWLHVRDSSSLDDLTVTTSDTTAIDEIVIIEGKLALDKDYGYGYKYPVIVEDARLVK